MYQSEFLNFAFQQPSTSYVHSIQESCQFGAVLSLPNQPRPCQDDIAASLSLSTLQTFDSVLSHYEHFVQQDRPVLPSPTPSMLPNLPKANINLKPSSSNESVAKSSFNSTSVARSNVIDYIPADTWPSVASEQSVVIGQLDRFKTSQAFQEQQTQHQRVLSSLASPGSEGFSLVIQSESENSSTASISRQCDKS